MARSVRSKRRARNQRVKADKLKVFEQNRLDEIIAKRDSHTDGQRVKADELNIPPELQVLNKEKESTTESGSSMETDKIQVKQTSKFDESDSEDEAMEESNKVAKTGSSSDNGVRIHKIVKQKYQKIHQSKVKALAAKKKKKPII
ncbi:hypothetical protein CYY_007547 [Polysphondylium violaceum]|uniref:Uncharacterized protein n=1 Tax=Polysphondylium violaceum TaxID=133409 RepID=A0A8J4PX38_9MYCE|nr:hypothetical protein CYY_007547 [Polysphondylium violaceum]